SKKNPPNFLAVRTFTASSLVVVFVFFARGPGGNRDLVGERHPTNITPWQLQCTERTASGWSWRRPKGRVWDAGQMIPGSNVSRTLARTGVDWVLVDGEESE
ncbi:HpcH/HpaI aldolase/citrate lyase family protein, partial [Diplocarpon rosae]